MPILFCSSRIQLIADFKYSNIKDMETKKRFNGKALYQPSGKAGEYAGWAVNFYTGCSNNCDYCYCKRGVMAHVWSNRPHLKKCFKSEFYAFSIFKKEVEQNIEDVRKSGLLLSFTTDPLLPETMELTFATIVYCYRSDIPVSVLTKCTDWSHSDRFDTLTYLNHKEKIAFGFTLTGHDEMEPGAPSNTERIKLMQNLHTLGFKTFASIEPVIDIDSAESMIRASEPYCDLFKIGLRSGVKKDYLDKKEVSDFVQWFDFCIDR